MELVTLLTPKHTSCQLGSLTEWVSSPSYEVRLSGLFVWALLLAADGAALSGPHAVEATRLRGD